MVKEPSANGGEQVQPLGWEDNLEKEMVTQSSILAWKIPWTEELGRLPSMGSSLLRAFSICGEQRLLSSCTAPAFHCRGFSHCGARALGLLGFSAL